MENERVGGVTGAVVTVVIGGCQAADLVAFKPHDKAPAPHHSARETRQQMSDWHVSMTRSVYFDVMVYRTASTCAPRVSTRRAPLVTFATCYCHARLNINF